MVIEGEFRQGIVLANKCCGGFNSQFCAGAAVGGATGPVRNKDSEEGRFGRIGFNLSEATILAHRAGNCVGCPDRRGGRYTPRHTEAHPCGGCNGTSVPGVDCDTERKELDNQLNRSRNRKPSSRNGSRTLICCKVSMLAP